MSSPIVFHEDYIPGSNDDITEGSSLSVSDSTEPLSRQQTNMSTFGDRLVPGDLLSKALPTSSVSHQNALSRVNTSVEDSPSRTGSPSRASAQSVSGGGTAPVSPRIRIYEGSSSVSGDSNVPLQNGDDTEHSLLDLGRLLTPMVNDMRSNYSVQRREAIDTEAMSVIPDFPVTLEYANHEGTIDSFFAKHKHFIILSSAGKPIYSMHGPDDIVTVYSGVIQTIIAFFQYLPDGSSQRLRSVLAQAPDTGEKMRFVFLDKSPILLMACSTLDESAAQLGQQLDFLYNFLLATLSKPHIDKVFQLRDNFDLRHLLGKADIACMDAICNNLSNFNNPGIVVGGLECLRLHQSLRNRIDKTFLKHRVDNVLYGMLVAPGGRLVNVLRPKRYTLHTSDLQLLFSTIYNTNTFRDDENGALSSNQDFWVPVCLPKFNPNGFLYAFIQFVQLKDERLMQLHDINMDALKADQDGDTELAVILLSAYKDTFFDMRKSSHNIVQDIRMSRSIYRGLYKAVVGTQGADGTTGFSAGRVSPVEIPAPFVKHFIYKNKKCTQYVYSRLETFGADTRTLGTQLMLIYSKMHSKRQASVAVSDRDSDEMPSHDNSAALGPFNYLNMTKWKIGADSVTGVLISTSGYDLYLMTNGGVEDRSKLIASCKRIVRWCKKNQDKLFIESGAVY